MTAPNRILIFADRDESAEWLVDRIEGLEDSSFSVASIDSYDGEIESADIKKADAIIVDSSLGPDTAQRLLYDLMIMKSALPVILCIAADEQNEFPSAVRQGAQDFIVRGADSPEIIHRVLHHALDRAQILRATQDAEERVRAIIENISDGILIVDEGNTILFANPACETILNKALIELLGAPLEIEIPRASDATVEIQHTADFSIVASIRWVPIRWEGRNVRLYTIRDISTEHETREQLKKARDTAERMAALKSSFLANMSHELRMPLASIIGFAQLIEEGVDDEEFREFSQMIVESGNKLLETINSVLELTRMDAQAVETRRQRLNLSDSAASVASSMKPLIREKNLSVEIIQSDDDEIVGDALVVRRIFNNLIGNAIKFTEEGRIQIVFKGEPEGVVCTVTDTGIGIDADFLPHVFDEFAQESTGRSRTHGGTGLGLAITQRLVQSLNGEISVASKKGEGSTFTIRFPRESPIGTDTATS